MPIGFKGHIRAPNKDHLVALSYQRHRARLLALHGFATPPAFDSRTLSIVGPIKDQKQCGSCWNFSGTGVCEIAFYKAGMFASDGSKALSEQYTMSCGKNGGCNGDDNVTVLDWCKKTGLPTTADYGPYTANSGHCAWKSGMSLYKIDDWGFADSNGGNGVCPVQDIKNAIVAYGCVGAGVAAGGDSFWNDGQGVGTGRSSSIDHDVIIVGWNDSQGKGGAWIMRNSWGSSWGSGCGISGSGCGWVQYGAYDLGTEAVWAVVHNPNPVNPWGGLFP